MVEVSATQPGVAGTGFGPGLFAGIACLGDILLLRGWLLGQIATVETIALHSGFALALGLLALLARRRLSQSVLVAVILLILLGPLGGPALMIAGPAGATARPRAFGPATKDAPRPPSTRTADDIFNQIRQGRRHPLPQQEVGSFLRTFQDGTLRQQQEAISALSRSYHPDMRPALSAALASPVPALRVQAAAVYAKLRGTYEARAKELLALGKADAGLSDGTFTDECLAVAQSGFLDSETQACLRELSSRRAETARPRVPSPTREPLQDRLRPALQPSPRLKRYACGGLG